MSNTKDSPAKRFANPVRWGAFITLAIVLGGSALYFILFFDLHLRKGMEAGLTAVNGAHVDIDSVKTRFLKGEIAIARIQVGSDTEPMKNRVEVAAMRFRLKLLPLLKKKFVVEESSIEGMRYGTARTYSAAVPLPPKGNSEFAQKLMGGFEKMLKDKVGEGEVEKVGSLLQGGDIGGKAAKIGEDSYSFRQIKETERLVDSSGKEVEAQLKAMPNEKAVADVKGKIDAIAQAKPRNVEEAARLIGDVQSLQKQAEDLTAKAKQAGETATRLAGTVNQSVQAVDAAMNKDLDYLKKQMKIPSLNYKDLTLPLLGPKLGGLLNKATYYVELSRKYMPPKKKGEAEPVVVQERGKGRDYEFGKVRQYPTFLLEKALLTSALSEDPTQGEARGELAGINSNPPLYGRPMTAALSASFPRAKVTGAKAQLVVDHVTENAKEMGQFSVATFPVEEWTLSEGNPFGIKIAKASGSGTSQIRFENDSVEWLFQVGLTQVDYQLSADNDRVLAILKRAVGSLSTFNLSGRILARGGDWSLDLRSDLGERLGNAISNEIKGQIEAAQAQVQKQLHDAVDAKRRELTTKVEAFRKNTLGPLESRVGSVNDLKSQANQQIERLNRERDQLIQGKAQEELNKLKNNIKLPGF